MKNNIINRLKWEISCLVNYSHYIKFKKSVRFKVLSDYETIMKIVDEGCSVSRYGDGEYLVMNNLGNGFQSPNPILKDRLYEVLNNNNSKHLVCIPRAYISMDKFKRSAKRFWYEFISEYGDFVTTVTPVKIYGDTNFTRFYMDYNDRDFSKSIIEMNKKIWEDRNLLIVEGKNTKLGCGNDLFANARSIRRILCPAKDAFGRYDEILKTTLKYARKDDLILIALGMTATVLSYDLSNAGFQSIDIGHIDIEYEWYLSNAKQKTLVKGKAVNECCCNEPEDVFIDSDYKKSIVEYVL